MPVTTTAAPSGDVRVPAAAHLRTPFRLTVGGVVVGLAVSVVAVGARVAELRDVPRLTDETDEVMRGLQIARGELLPLTNVDAYIGPLWNYLLALGFLLFGTSSTVPRVLTLLISLMTVAAAVWLGRELARRLGRDDLAGLLGGGAAWLLAASGCLAIVSARIGWSHALTPLFMTLAMAALLRWERTRSTNTLVGAGLAYGLAVHTHPTAVAFAPGLLVWALLHWRAALLSRAGWLALTAALVANLPMLAFNISSGFGSAAAAVQVQLAYSGGEVATPAGFVRNLGALLTSLPMLLAGEIGERRGVMETVDGPVAFVCAGLALLGLAVVSWRRVALPALLLVSMALVLPIVNGKYEPLFNGRYVAPLLPLGFALTVLAVVIVAEWIPCRGVFGGARARGASLVGAALIVFLLAVPPLLSLQSYITATLRDGPNNRELFRAVEIVAAASPSKPILVDSTLSGARVSTGRDGTGVLEYLLILDTRLPIRRLTPDELLAAAERGEADIVIVSPRLFTRLDKDRHSELPPGELEARRERRANFSVVRVLGKV